MSSHLVSRPDSITVLIIAVGIAIVLLLGWIGTLLRRGRRTGVYCLCGYAAFLALSVASASRSGKPEAFLIALASLTTGAAIWSLTYWKSLR